MSMKSEKCHNPNLCQELRQSLIRLFYSTLVEDPNADKLGNIYINPRNPRQIIVELLKNGLDGAYVVERSLFLNSVDRGSIPQEQIIKFAEKELELS